MNVITESEMLDAIREATQPNARPPGFLTTHEMARGWGVAYTTVQRRIRPLLRSGEMERVWISEFDVTGRRQRVAAYRLTKKAKR